MGCAKPLVVVSGASSLIGRAFIRKSKQLGAIVIAVDKKPIPTSVDLFFELDLTDINSIVSVANSLPNQIDLLVNTIEKNCPGDLTEIIKRQVLGPRLLVGETLELIASGGSVVHVLPKIDRCAKSFEAEIQQFIFNVDFQNLSEYCRRANLSEVYCACVPELAIRHWANKHQSALSAREISIEILEGESVTYQTTSKLLSKILEAH